MLHIALYIYEKMRGGVSMKVINPVGRSASNYVDANLDPRACMCAVGLSFSSALGYEDNCNHCGCNCMPWNSEANYNVAYNANYASG